jgi:hypothetical protein
VALGAGGLCPALAQLLAAPATATDGDTRFRTLKLLCDTLSAFLHHPLLYGPPMADGHVAPPPVSRWHRVAGTGHFGERRMHIVSVDGPAQAQPSRGL